MKFYMLNPTGTMVVKVSDDRTAEFNSKKGWDDEAREVVLQIEILREEQIPMYTENRLKYFFPELQEISKDEYDNSIAAISEFNATQKKLEAEVNAASLSDIRAYLSVFPAEHPDLINFEQMADISRTIALSSQDADPTDGSTEATEDTLRLLYSVALSTERTGDRSLVESLLEVSEFLGDKERIVFIDDEEDDEIDEEVLRGMV